MFNNFVLNTTPFNTSGFVAGAGAQDDIVFENYSLQESDIITGLLLHDSGPIRDYRVRAAPRDDGEVSLGDYFRRRIIKITGYIKKSSSSLLESELDNMKKALATKEGNLDIKIDGTIRRFVSTLNRPERMFERRKGYHVTLCPFDLEFRCIDPYGKSVGYVADTFASISDLIRNDDINHAGTARAKPIFILNFSAASGVTAIDVLNNTTGEEIKLTTSISAGDYIRFDSEEREVTKNGTVQDCDGIFPDLNSGNNAITVTITGTSATFTLTIKRKNTYL